MKDMVDFSDFWYSLKTKWRKFVDKTGLTTSGGSFGYKRNAVITYCLISIAVTAVAFYFIGNFVASESLNPKINELSRLNLLKDALVAKLNESLISAQNETSSIATQMSTVQNSLSNCQNNLQGVQGNITSLQNVSLNLQTTLTSCQGSLLDVNSTLQNSVRAVCCSFGDVEAGVSKNWQIFSDRIVCSGNSTVNCGTGQIS